MATVQLASEDLLWLQQHPPKVISDIHRQVSWAVDNDKEADEVRYTGMELAAKRTLDAVKHAAEQVRAIASPLTLPAFDTTEEART